MSSSSSSSSSSSHNHNHNNARDSDIPGPSRAIPPDSDEPSSSRPRRAMNEVWPDPFLEDLTIRVAIDASLSYGRLSAAPSLANLFQVCSRWQAVSRSDHLWQRLNGAIWRRVNLARPTWYEEFIHWHRMARNFALGRYASSSLGFGPSDMDDDHFSTVVCRCLTLSDDYLACGFTDGTVRLFHLDTRVHFRTYRTHQANRLGPFARSVSGIVIADNRLIFSTLDGDIYVADIDEPTNQTRRARICNVVESGVLVDFAGRGRWWVGLFAGVSGQAFQIWDAENEQLVFIGGTLTDAETVNGWHMLAEFVEPVGRIRVTNGGLAVACTSSQLVVLDLNNRVFLHELWSAVGGFIVTSMDVSDEAFFIVERNGDARVRRASTLEQLCQFRTRRVRGLMRGCRNMGYALTCAGGVVRVWDVERPRGQLRLVVAGERVAEGMAMVCNERHVAISGNDRTIHLWDFNV
ncbi:hypothetical protein K1719_019990 [Acacia pycnantha]|nr:hypothetical protein K1719_019990 [Acacia pycnantha]